MPCSSPETARPTRCEREEKKAPKITTKTVVLADGTYGHLVFRVGRGVLVADSDVEVTHLLYKVWSALVDFE